MKFPFLILTIPFLLAACSVLEPVEDKAVNHLLDPVIPERRITGARPAIAISRPALPSYLDRQQLVSRSGDGRVQMNSYHLWAEPLDSAISRVTALNLGRLTNSLNIQPVESFVTLDYRTLLEIRITRFEPDVSNHLILECTWKLQPVSGRVADTRSFRTSVAISPADTPKEHSGRIAAMNEALARLAREIARAL
ncbi:MAG: PqiC family protein [Akkermansiaceae bacterium]